MALTVHIFTKVTVYDWHYGQISCTEFHANRSKNVKSEGRNLFAPVSTTVTESTFNKITFSETHFVETTRIRDFMKTRMVVDHLQMDSRVDVGITLLGNNLLILGKGLLLRYQVK
jgi:hypothetical protein